MGSNFKVIHPISMIILISIICLFSPGYFQATESLIRQKRNLFEFGLMVAQLTHRSPIDFNNYGNYCGLGGEGIPVDEIDRCCQKHDKCYGEVDLDCTFHLDTIGLLMHEYKFVIREKKIYCIDTETNSTCGRDLCLCDKGIAECLALHLGQYNASHRNIKYKQNSTPIS